MYRLRVTRLSILAMASLMLIPASGAFASLISYSSPGDTASLRFALFATNPEFAELTQLAKLVEDTKSAISITPDDLPFPGRETPTDDRGPSLWNLIQVALGGSTQSGSNNPVNSKTQTAVWRFATFSCHASDRQGNELFLIDFQFVPDTIPDAREKPPKHSNAG